MRTAKKTVLKGLRNDGFKRLKRDSKAFPAPDKKNATDAKIESENDNSQRDRPVSTLSSIQENAGWSQMTCIVPGDPVAWARAIPLKSGGAVTEGKQARHKALLMTYMRRVWGNREPLAKNHACELDCTFVFQAKKRGEPGRLHAKRPDLDNLVKQVADALQGRKQSLVIYDDGQIASITARKIYGEKPMTIMRLKWSTNIKNTVATTSDKSKKVSKSKRKTKGI